MNSGCGVISSQGPGATGFMIKHKENGLVYNFRSFNSLYKNVKLLFDDIDFCEKLGMNAYDTIINTWNAETATRNLMKLLENLSDGADTPIKDGPASKAKITPRAFMYHRLTHK